MADKVWKAAERRVGRIFNVRRRRGSGSDPETGADDIFHPQVFAEVRYRKRYGVLRWWDEDVVDPAKSEGKFPVLVIVEKYRSQIFAVVPLDVEYLKKLLGFLEHGKVGK